MKIKAYWIYGLLFLLSLTACGQTNVDRSVFETFTAEQYRADLTQMANQLKGFHPKMYEYVSKDSFDMIVEDKLATFTDSTTLGEFIWSARQISSLVACGHTFVPTLSRKFTIPDECMFPLHSQYVGDRLFVFGNNENTEIALGTEILQINNRSVSELKGAIKGVLSADGNNLSFKDHKINDDFSFLCSYELGLPSKYTIDYRSEIGDIKTKSLNQLSANDLEYYKTNECPSHLCFDIDSDMNAATIRIASFVFYNENLPEFKNFIDDCFKKIDSNKIENVIIDIRGNGGGDPYCASYLLQYIASEPFQYYRSGTSDYYGDLQKEISLMDIQFEGDLYIITDGRCFSTSGHFLSLIKHYNIGTIVGRESGATYRCNANTTELKLRFTDVSCYISRATYSTIADELPADRGIIPDYIVEYTKEDLLENVDRDLEVVKGLIKR